MSQHTTENRATIEELKQEMIVNSILSDMVKVESDQYVNRLTHLEKQVQLSLWYHTDTINVYGRFIKVPLY